MDENQNVTLERVAASNDPFAAGALVGGLDRAALVAAGLQAFPTLLCQDQGSGCTVSPAVVGIDPVTGLLDEPFNPSFGSDVSCDVTIRFANGEAAAELPLTSVPSLAVLLFALALLGMAVLARAPIRDILR
jgi:hypothetical protein